MPQKNTFNCHILQNMLSWSKYSLAFGMKNVEKGPLMKPSSDTKNFGDIKFIAQKISEILAQDFSQSPSVRYAKKELFEVIENTQKWVPPKNVGSIIYTMLTTRDEFTALSESADNDLFLVDYLQKVQAQNAYYSATIEEIKRLCDDTSGIEYGENPAWLSLNSQYRDESQEKVNFKQYLSIDARGFDAVSKIFALAVKLSALAKDSQDSIKVKIPSSLLGFLSHNDSVVIHFKAHKNKAPIEQILNEWVQTQKIQKIPRPFGRASFSIDPASGSVSELISQQIETRFEEQFGNYPNEALIDATIAYAIDLAQKVPLLNGVSIDVS